MTYKHEVYKDLEEIVIRVSTFGQYVPVTISYKRDNLILEDNKKDAHKEKILDFIASKFYDIMLQDNKKHFFVNGSGNLMFGTDMTIIVFDGQTRDIRFWINQCGKIEVSISPPHFTIDDIVDKVNSIQNAICDKDYIEILINKIKGE